MIFWFTVLFALSTLVSQSAMDLFSGLLCIAVLAKIAQRVRAGENWRQVILPIGFDWIWPLWLAIVALSFIFSPLEKTGWLVRLLEFRWGFVLYAMIYALNEMKIARRAQKAASLLLGFCSLYAIIVYFVGIDPFHPGDAMAPWGDGGHRAGGFLANAMTFGHLYGTVFCLFVGPTLFALKEKSAFAKFLVPAVLLTGFAVLLSFTRGIWIGMGVATLAMVFIFRVRLGGIFAIAGAALIAITAQLWPTLKERLTSALESGDSRQWIWKGHWRIFTEHPWTGVGYGENWRLAPEAFQAVGAPPDILVSHAHNQYLHFLAGTGVIGLIVYVIFLSLFLRLNVVVYRAIPQSQGFHKGLALGCLGSQISFWIGGLTEANFEHSKMKYTMLIIWAVVVWLSYEYGNQSKNFRSFHFAVANK